MFVPVNSNQPKIGDELILKKNVKVLKGTCLKGSKIRITGWEQMRGYSFIDLESGEKFIECGYDFWEVGK